MRLLYLECQLTFSFDSAPALAPRSRKYKPQSFEMSDAERDARSGMEWIDSVKSYLNFRMGRDWRRLNRVGQRYNETRWYYLDGLRLLNQLRDEPSHTFAYLPEETTTIAARAGSDRLPETTAPHKKPVQSVDELDCEMAL